MKLGNGSILFSLLYVFENFHTKMFFKLPIIGTFLTIVYIQQTHTSLLLPSPDRVIVIVLSPSDMMFIIYLFVYTLSFL